jgi:hypothetical protein
VEHSEHHRHDARRVPRAALISFSAVAFEAGDELGEVLVGDAAGFADFDAAAKSEGAVTT